MTLNDKINILYNFSYSNNDNFTLPNIDIKDINIEDYKISNTLDKDIYNNLLTEIFNGNFKIINYNDDLMITNLKKYSDNLNIQLSLVPYKLLENKDSFNESNNLDSIFSYIFSHLVLKKKQNIFYYQY